MRLITAVAGTSPATSPRPTPRREAAVSASVSRITDVELDELAEDELAELLAEDESVLQDELAHEGDGVCQGICLDLVTHADGEQRTRLLDELTLTKIGPWVW